MQFRSRGPQCKRGTGYGNPHQYGKRPQSVATPPGGEGRENQRGNGGRRWNAESTPTDVDGSEKIVVPPKGPEKLKVPEKLYTKNRKEKAKEKLKAQYVLKDLQVESGKSSQTSPIRQANHLHKNSPSPTKAKKSIPTYREPPSPSTLAANIIASIITQPTSEEKSEDKKKKAQLDSKIQSIPKFTLGKS